MSILRAFIALAVAGWLVGCRNRLVNQAVSQCEQAALDNCTKIGHSDSHLCYLMYARYCSTEDFTAAHNECLRIVGETPNSDIECILHWP